MMYYVPVIPKLAEQVFSQRLILKKQKMGLSLDKIVQEPFSGYMKGDLFLTDSFLMFLCKEPKVEVSGKQRAARFAVGVATLGWSQVATGFMDKRNTNKLQTQLNHPYSFAIPLKDIIRFERKKSGGFSRWDVATNHIRLDFMGTDVVPIYVLNDLDEWNTVFEQVQHLFSESQISEKIIDHNSPSSIELTKKLKIQLAKGEITPEEFKKQQHDSNNYSIEFPQFSNDLPSSIELTKKLKIQLAKGEITPEEFKARQNSNINDSKTCSTCGSVSDDNFCTKCGNDLRVQVLKFPADPVVLHTETKNTSHKFSDDLFQKFLQTQFNIPNEQSDSLQPISSQEPVNTDEKEFFDLLLERKYEEGYQKFLKIIESESDDNSDDEYDNDFQIQLCLITKRYNDAKLLIEKNLSHNSKLNEPDSKSDFLFSVGSSYFLIGQLNEGVKWIKQALDLDYDTSNLEDFSIFLAKNGYLKYVDTIYNHAIKLAITNQDQYDIDHLEDEYAQIYYNLGKSDLAEKKIQQGLSLIKKGIEIEKGRNFDNLSDELIKQKSLNHTLSLYDYAIEQFPQNDELIEQKIDILREKMDDDQALLYLETFLKKFPKRIDAWKVKGDVYQDIEKYKDAIKCYKKILKIDKNNEDAKSEIEDCKDM